MLPDIIKSRTPLTHKQYVPRPGSLGRALPFDHVQEKVDISYEERIAPPAYVDSSNYTPGGPFKGGTAPQKDYV